MQQFIIPTKDDIRAAVRDELTSFFSSHHFQPQTEIDEIGGIDLAVQITGLAKPTIYALVSDLKIPHSKPSGKKLYFSRLELLNWLKAGKRKTSAELALEAENHNPKRK